MLCFLYEKDYEQGTFLCDNLNFGQEMAFGYYYVLFGIVILKKSNSAKASLHYFLLFSL